ncbi:hypothetical protein GCM10025869_27920 [Homoserinibacter gongjuensis]|uniref:M20/M25/M40 family metallo-hydrolase n=1 Tax=Homoserinibacter gongjuensis TaxID=1162968 RepID=A0ABQ6JVC7_9MICO|nr:hypothetical protein GCM10025869_27920 [Homoserinibacter gongjuensis]
MSDALERFRELLRFPTYSHDGASGGAEASAGFQAALERSFPLVHERLERELVAGRSLLFRWPGADAAAASVLMAHQDVVTVDDPDRWTHPPFDAALVGEGEEAAVWARGALDDKAALAAILEAVESRLAAGFTPRGDVYLAFGHDEESGGTGADAIVTLLADRGVRPWLVIDEGGAVMDALLPGLGPTAVVGVTEKGMMNVELVVETPGVTPPSRCPADRRPCSHAPSSGSRTNPRPRTSSNPRSGSWRRSGRGWAASAAGCCGTRAPSAAPSRGPSPERVRSSRR